MGHILHWYTVMATGTTVELTEIQCVTAKVQEVKECTCYAVLTTSKGLWFTKEVQHK